MNKAHKIRDDLSQMVSKMRGIFGVNILTFVRNVRVREEEKKKKIHSACTFTFNVCPICRCYFSQERT